MRKLWTEERPSFEGRWVRFPPVICRPKPVQKPHPPVILGGMGPNARKRVAAWGDGWLPIGLPPDEVAEARREISRRALEHDRDPETLSLSVMIGAPPGLETPSLETIPTRHTPPRAQRHQRRPRRSAPAGARLRGPARGGAGLLDDLHRLGSRGIVLQTQSGREPPPDHLRHDERDIDAGVGESAPSGRP